jgi:hypothetical protein
MYILSFIRHSQITLISRHVTTTKLYYARSTQCRHSIFFILPLLTVRFTVHGVTVRDTYNAISTRPTLVKQYNPYQHSTMHQWPSFENINLK